MGRLDGKVVMVSGGSSGIGEAITQRFAREGATVAFCSRRAEAGEGLEASLKEEGHECLFTRCDVGSEPDVKRWTERVVEKFGRLDGVVNNAAITIVTPLELMKTADWEQTIRINVTGMFFVARETIPHLRAAGGGSIINLGSTFGVVGAVNAVAYGLTKAAAISLSKGLAVELAGDGIRVNALCPGGTETPFTEAWLRDHDDPDAVRADLEASHPMGRMGTPAEQANAALFLMSDESEFVTGHALLIDGGYTAQ